MKMQFDLRSLKATYRGGGQWIWFAGSLLYLLIGILPATGAQPGKTSPVAPVRDDRAPVHVRYPTPDHLHDLQTARAYQYGRNVPSPENPVARFFTWLFKKMGEFLSSKAYENVWQYVILVAIASVVIYLLMKAEVLGFLFPKKAQTTELSYGTLSENIHEIDFDTAIDEAFMKKDFRLAVRLLYLQTLKRLTDTGLINYQPDKTNRQYVYELANSAFQSDFETLTRQFEFVWYGNFPVEEVDFQLSRHQFQQFNQSLNP